MKCDFCSEPEPAWSYPAATVRVVSNHVSDGDWAACDACHDLIEAKDFNALADRSLIYYRGRYGDRPGAVELLATLRDIHVSFQQACLGQPRRVK